MGSGERGVGSGERGVGSWELELRTKNRVTLAKESPALKKQQRVFGRRLYTSHQKAIFSQNILFNSRDNNP